MQKSIQYIKEALSDKYPENELRTIINILLSKITGFSNTQLIVNKNTIFSDEQLKVLYSFIEKLKKNVPVQYVVGETEFFGLTLKVSPAVLIPRPETEELIEWIAASFAKTAILDILDIGTGSGCIPLAVKSVFRNANVNGVDISSEALDIAKENSKNLNLDVTFKQADVFEMQTDSDQWDIIVSNPPYIPLSNIKEMDANVVDNEPNVALFVTDADPLIFYKTIARFAFNGLKENGALFFEIHKDFGQECVEMLKQTGFKNVEMKKDLSGNDRMIKAMR